MAEEAGNARPVPTRYYLAASGSTTEYRVARCFARHRQLIPADTQRRGQQFAERIVAMLVELAQSHVSLIPMSSARRNCRPLDFARGDKGEWVRGGTADFPTSLGATGTEVRGVNCRPSTSLGATGREGARRNYGPLEFSPGVRENGCAEELRTSRLRSGRQGEWARENCGPPEFSPGDREWVRARRPALSVIQRRSRRICRLPRGGQAIAPDSHDVGETGA